MIALDATYSVGTHLSGVGVYSNEILYGLASTHPASRFLWCYRLHRVWPGLKRRLPSNCRRLVLWETRAPRRADLFHGLNQRMPAARCRRAVTTFHDLFVLTGEYSTGDFRRRFSDQARRAAERADLVIAVSCFTASQVEEHLGVERSRIRVVPHGLRRPLQEATRTREPVILHVGAIQKRKNVSRLVRAFERTPPGWRLLLAGSEGFGAEEVAAAIEASPRRLDIARIGYVSSTELDNLYSRASIFAFPSLDEGFGMPVLEAMAHGVPVITSNRSSLPEVAGDAALLVDPFDEEAIAAALQSLIESEALQQELRAKGLARATQFSWESALQQTWSVYLELLN